MEKGNVAEKNRGKSIFKRRTSKKNLNPQQLRRRKRKRLIIFLSVVGVLLIFRILLPTIVLRYVNNKLANLTEYYGHVEDIDIHLYRGAYVINDIKIMKRNKKTQDSIPFFSSKKIDLSVEWPSIFNGSLVGEMDFIKPVLNYVEGAHVGEDIQADTADFRSLIDALMPLTVNRFDIHQGELHYINLHSSPNLDIFMTNIEGKGTNLSNIEDADKILPATLFGKGELYEGNFYLNVEFDPMADNPTFDLSSGLEGVNLVLLNDLLTAIANVDVKKGNLNLYTEFAAKDGKIAGYLKPILKDMNIVQWNKDEGNVPQIAWEMLVSMGVHVFQNQIKGEFATKIPINGDLKKPDVHVWDAFLQVLKNAFIHALKPKVDDTIDIENLKEEKSPFMKLRRKKKKTNDD